MRKIILNSFIIALLCSCNANGPAENETDGAVANTARGKELFQTRCSACHGVGGRYRNNNAADLQVSKVDSLTIVTTIINGKGAMPMFAHVFADSDLAQLELYVKTLRN